MSEKEPHWGSPGAEGEGVVLPGEGLVLWENPSQGSERVAVLPQFSKVKMGEPGAGETVDGMTSRWYRIGSPAGEGWAFGAFLAISGKGSHCECAAEKVYVSVGKDGEHREGHFIVRGLNYTGDGRFPCFFDAHRFGYDHTSRGYTVSASGKWIAIDQGSEAVGTLNIVEFASGKVAWSGPYDRELGEWEGDRLRFFFATGKELGEDPSGVYFEETKELVFERGKTRATGNRGRIGVY